MKFVNIFISFWIFSFSVILSRFCCNCGILLTPTPPIITTTTTTTNESSIENIDEILSSYFDELLNIERSSKCIITINEDLIEPQPLFLIPRTNKFWNPTGNGTISIRSGTTIELFCTEYFKNPFKKRKLLQATCINDDIFLVDNKRYEFEELICKDDNYHIARRTGNSCAENSNLIEIGFQIINDSEFAIDNDDNDLLIADDNNDNNNNNTKSNTTNNNTNINRNKRFLRTLLICHNENNQSTQYVQHNLTAGSNSYQKSVPRINFIQGDFYKGKDVNRLYTKVQQKQTIGKILGGNHEKYFNDKKSLFLARGHLSAKVDHIFAPQQQSTFYYINAAPQWQRFNAGNWERIEDGVRRFVAKNHLNVECYTGTWGISELRDARGKFQKLYLSIDKDNNNNNNSNGQIPVPKLYYRVVIDQRTRYGIVLIGINNPHLTLDEIKKDNIICSDISDKIKWINWKKDDISKGYSYACDVKEFTRVVRDLPQLNVKGILY